MSTSSTTVACLTLSEQQVAQLLGVSPVTVRRLKKANKLPQPKKIGGRSLFLRAEVEQWLANGCPACPLTRTPRR